MPNEVYVFADEAGTTNASVNQGDERFYVVAAIVVPSKDLARITEEVEAASQLFNHGSLLKSAKIGANVDRRIQLFKLLHPINFRYYALACDKQKIDETSGLKYRKSFYKYLNGRLYSEISRNAMPLVHVLLDTYGSAEFQQSAIDYFEKMGDLFNPLKVDRIEDQNSRLIQLADIVAGTLRLWLLHSNECKYLQLRKELAHKEISFQCFPVRYTDPQSIPFASSLSPEDETLARVMIEESCRIITEYENSENCEEQMQAQVLKLLPDALAYNEGDKYCDALMDVVNRGREKPINRKSFLSNVIGAIRRRGVIITGSNTGYRIASSLSDVSTYLQHNTRILIPMLDKLKCARRLIETSMSYDILESEEYRTLKSVLQVIDEDRVTRFAAPGRQEIDDERIFPS